jgi:hypothetical protein
LSAADLDRDGDMDLAVLALNEFEEDEFETQVVALLNDGRGEFPERRRLFLERFSLARDLVLFDADGDGDQDAGLAERPFCDRCGASAVRLSLLWNRSEPPASRDRNHDRIPDECGRPLFHRGDATADGGLDAADAVLVLAAAFLSPGPVPGCLEAADANNDGRIDLTDALVILNFVFLGGAAPAFPGPGGSPCDADPDAPGSPRDLGCRAYPPCG